jgi:hypothetical protein
MVQQWTILRLVRFQTHSAHLAASLPFTSMLSGVYQARQHGRKAAPTILPRRGSTTPPQQQEANDNSRQVGSVQREGRRKLA